jgi:hypothetical protein
MTLGFGWGSPTNQTIIGPPQRYGYEANMQVGANVVTGNMTSPEPTRLLMTSIGYGPRGAVKKLEAIIQKDFFNGLSAPATLTLVGPTSTASPLPVSTFNFDPGSSTVAVYSGDDAVSTDIIPPIGTINDANLDTVEGSVDGPTAPSIQRYGHRISVECFGRNAGLADESHEARCCSSIAI